MPATCSKLARSFVLYNASMPPRGNSRGARTRTTILQTAAGLASVDGLDGLSIGRLATELAMSKSGLFAHFGSKEELQLATIEEARQLYAREVIEPARAAGVGIMRLQALCEAFLSYLERAVFPGGCFFASAMAEFDSKAPGPVRDRIALCQDQWMSTLERAARQAEEREELRAGADPGQLAFELEAALLSANWYFHLFNDATYLDRARRAVRARLASEATPPACTCCSPTRKAGETTAGRHGKPRIPGARTGPAPARSPRAELDHVALGRQGSRVSASAWTGRTTVKCRRSSVATSVSRNRSARAMTEASVVPSGRLP